MAGMQASARGVPSWSWHPGRVRRPTGDVLSIQAPAESGLPQVSEPPGEKGNRSWGSRVGAKPRLD